jgi:anti-anti-sigma factor
MAFSMTSEFNGDTAIVTVAGSLDAGSAPALTAEVQKAVAQKCTKLVLMVQDLEYIASAGLRVILFAKQKMGSQTDIYVIAPQEQVISTLERSGFDQAVIIQDEYQPIVRA